MSETPAKEIRLTVHQINTLASLVQRELLGAMDELNEDNPDERSTLEYLWDLYYVILPQSTMPGIRGGTNPYSRNPNASKDARF